MLSKKMAFSLMSLITIIALAFVAPSAMAGDFSTAITVDGHDVSHQKGEQRTAGNGNIQCYIWAGRRIYR